MIGKSELRSRMLKVVLDTNIVISSALCVEGNPAKIFELLLREKIENYTSEEIIKEIKSVFARPKIAKRLSLKDAKFIIANFEYFSKKVKPNMKINKIEDDPEDNKFLECAFTASVDYIISGDEHLLKLREFKGIKITTPAEFLKIIINS